MHVFLSQMMWSVGAHGFSLSIFNKFSLVVVLLNQCGADVGVLFGKMNGTLIIVV